MAQASENYNRTQGDDSLWYIDSELSRLRDALNAAKELNDTQHVAQQRAVVLALADVDRRLSDANKFREQIVQERGDYLHVELYRSEHQRLQDRVRIVEDAVSGYLRVENYQIDQRSVFAWRDTVNAQLSSLMGGGKALAALASTIGAAVAILVSHFWK